MPNKDKELLDFVENEIKNHISNYERLKKEDSFLLKAANYIVGIFNKDFMDGYVTTIYPKVYFPNSKKSDYTISRVLAHEFIHLLSAKRQNPIVHGVLYLFPQALSILSLLSLLAIWFSNFWLLSLIWLLMLLPIPAYFRMKEELKAYTMTMAVIYWKNNNNISKDIIESIATRFYGPGYYWMWPFKKDIITRLEKNMELVRIGLFDNEYPFKTIKQKIQEIYFSI